MGSEFWYPVLESNNSDQYQILQKLGDHGILVKFQRNFDQNSFQGLNDYGILQGFWSLLFSRFRWPQNSYEILQGFRSEFWWPQKFQRDFDQNSFQDLNDHGILQGIQMATEFFKDFDKNYFQELDDHWILMKFFEDFDQNSGSQH